MTNRKTFLTGSPWEEKVGYSRAIVVGNIIEVAGTTAVYEEKIVGKGDIYTQTIYILNKIKSTLEKAGTSLEHVTRTRMFVTNIDLWEDAGKAHGEFFKDIKPAATMVEVSKLIHPDLMIEIEVTAVL